MSARTALARVGNLIRFPRERRAAGGVGLSSWGWSGAAIAAGGQVVNPRLAENLSAVLGAVQLVSSSMAALPASVVRLTAAGKVAVPDDPVARLIAEGPNAQDCWTDFIEFTAAQMLGYGNALVEIESNSAGRITGLKPIPWAWVTVFLGTNGHLYYDVLDLLNIVGSTGRPRRLLQQDSVHLKLRSDDGYIGRSPLSRAAGAVNAAMASQAAAEAIQKNGLMPSGVVTGAGRLPPDAMARMRAVFRSQYQGVGAAGEPLILDAGFDFKSLSISPLDAQLLESRRFSVAEVARIFNCPSYLLGDTEHGAARTAGEASKWFAQGTLLPLIRRFEDAFSRQLFPAGSNLRLEFDIEGFLRADPAQRWQGYDIAARDQILTIDEIRGLEGFPPRPDGGGNAVLIQPGGALKGAAPGAGAGA